MYYNKQVLKHKIIFFSPSDPFTWASGIKAPIYCDNRLTLGFPKLRTYIQQQLANIIKEKYHECEIVIGTATAGIPHCSIVSHILDLPCGYVRSSAKDHGRKNMIEGIDVSNKKVVVIEDLISTGKSVFEVIDILNKNNCEVIGVLAIFNYEFQQASELFEKHNIKCDTISNITSLLKYSKKNGLLNETDTDLVKSFLKDPKTWYDREFVDK